MVPVWGQLGDVRDTSAAFYRLGDGGWQHGGNWLNLAAAGVAWVPGFDWVKGGSKGARRAAAAVEHTHLASAPPSTPHPLHRDSPVYPHPEGRPEHPGVDLDHRYSQTAFPERAGDPANLERVPSVENRGPKARAEKALLAYEEDLMRRTGWTRSQVRDRVTQPEWDSIARSVHPTYHPDMDHIAPR
jgi:hypothetical protein